MHDIIDTAVAAGSFKTLAAALTAANLIATLKGVGPFTVFAPTDEAFAKLPAGTVDALDQRASVGLQVHWLGLVGALPIVSSLLEPVYRSFLYCRPLLQSIEHSSQLGRNANSDPGDANQFLS
jgi:uncharacterized surface protein with fasciclin (FAS1) repeats